MTITMDQLMAAERSYSERCKADVIPFNKTAVFDALEAAGLKSAVVTFNGEGDSGQIDVILVFTEEQDLDEPDQWAASPIEIPNVQVTLRQLDYNWGDAPLGDPTESEVSLKDALEQVAYNLLEMEHGGWENNSGGFGTFVFDLATRTIRMNFNYRIESSEYDGSDF
jgi:hypothetical protein